MTDFGAGPFLDRELDFEVTSTGDIRTVDGVEELEKDVALQGLIELSVFRGTRQTTRTEAKIRSRVNDILLTDPRIDEVISTSVRFISSDNEVEIVTTVRSDNSDQELVFEVDNGI